MGRILRLLLPEFGVCWNSCLESSVWSNEIPETWLACVNINNLIKKAEETRNLEHLERGNEKSPNRRMAGEWALEGWKGMLEKRRVQGFGWGWGWRVSRCFFKCFFMYLTAPDLSCGKQDL